MIEDARIVEPASVVRRAPRPRRFQILADLRVATVIWGLFLFAIPFYVNASGLPQPSNALIVLLVPITLYRWDGRMRRSSRRTMRMLMWFLAWVTLVSVAWSAMTGSLEFLVYPLYYIFNGLVFLLATVLARRFGDTFLRITAYAVSTTVMFQVVASLVTSTTVYRGRLFFNNPNQLGFFALLAATVIVLLQRPLNLSRWKSSIVITGAAYLAVSSASRAAVVGIALLLFLLLFSNPRVIIGMTLAAAGLVSLGGPVARAFDLAAERATTDRDPKTSFFEERGYDRLWDFKEYMLLGAGEGAVDRFTEIKREQHEIHSSAATLLFSYGLVGIALFAAFLWRLCMGAGQRNALLMLPPLSYTIAHQGLRFTMLWVLLAVVSALRTRDEPRRR